jgi:hypothetical protein
VRRHRCGIGRIETGYSSEHQEADNRDQDHKCSRDHKQRRDLGEPHLGQFLPAGDANREQQIDRDQLQDRVRQFQFRSQQAGHDAEHEGQHDGG